MKGLDLSICQILLVVLTATTVGCNSSTEEPAGNKTFDPVASFTEIVPKKELHQFTKRYGDDVDKFTVSNISFDVQETSSLVTPYTAQLFIDVASHRKMKNAEMFRIYHFKYEYGCSNEQWELRGAYYKNEDLQFKNITKFWRDAASDRMELAAFVLRDIEQEIFGKTLAYQP